MMKGWLLPKERWGGLVFLLCVIAGFIYGGWVISYWLEDEQRVPLSRIIISGDRQYLLDESVRQVVTQGHQGSFFELNVDAVHRDLEALPWVYRASVRKRWPSTLTVYVVEQTPVAIWNSDLLLNTQGESFTAQLPDSELPSLFGPGGSESAALEGFRAMQTLLAPTGLGIAELTLSERFAWQVILNNQVELRLGRSQFVDRLQRFVDVYPLLQQAERPIAYVDLRYDTGLAVGWREDAQS